MWHMLQYTKILQMILLFFPKLPLMLCTKPLRHFLTIINQKEMSFAKFSSIIFSIFLFISWCSTLKFRVLLVQLERRQLHPRYVTGSCPPCLQFLICPVDASGELLKTRQRENSGVTLHARCSGIGDGTDGWPKRNTYPDISLFAEWYQSQLKMEAVPSTWNKF